MHTRNTEIPTAVQYASPRNPEKWRELWLRKYSKVLDRMQLPETAVREHYAAVDAFLVENPGNPRKVSEKKLVAFVNKADTVDGFISRKGRCSCCAADSLLYFFEKVAVSDTHVSVLRAVRDRKSSEIFQRSGAGNESSGGRMSNTAKDTPTDWPSVWVDTTARQLMKGGMTEKDARNAADYLRPLLALNACHPRAMQPDAIKRFLLDSRTNYPEAFQAIIHASYALYAKIGEKYPEEACMRKDVIDSFVPLDSSDAIERLVESLRLKGRSRDTISNYVREIRRYLGRLGRPPSADDQRDIEAHLLWLRSSLELKPGSVNLAAAAINYFGASGF